MTTVLNQREREQIAAAILAAAAKAEDARGLIMRVRGATITVTRRHTDFSVTYEKRPNSTQLQLTPSDHEAMPSKFRAIAFQAAVYKARELGWIV